MFWWSVVFVFGQADLVIFRIDSTGERFGGSPFWEPPPARRALLLKKKEKKMAKFNQKMLKIENFIFYFRKKFDDFLLKF